MNSQWMLPNTSAAAMLAALIAGTGSVQAAESFTEMFTQGKGHVALRYRLEQVDQDGFAEDALASTLRTRLNFQTDEWRGFGAFVEFDYLAEIGPDDYNAGAGNTPDRGQYPVVADPKGSDLNQAYIQWKSTGGILLRGGRQRIIFDNARFVGNVGWRQNEQTYDAAVLQQTFGPGVNVQLAYVDQVNRIFGDDVAAGQHENSTWLANVAYEWQQVGKLSAYYYDIDNRDEASFSTITYGGRFAGSQKLNTAAFGYSLEYAHQTDAHDNAVDYSADYYRIDLSLALQSFTPYAGYESLGGDDGRSGAAFRTPLATLHAFNGWADSFLSTPNQGLEDVFAGVKGSVGSWNWDVVYHDFQAEAGRGRFGSEIDAALSRKFAEKYSVLIKAAWFNADRDAAYADTTKLWLQLTADF